MITFIIPCYNAAPNLPDLIASLQAQVDPGWHAIMVNDMSTDETLDVMKKLSEVDQRVSYVDNTEKKYALRNIVETARRCDGPVGVIDGDDQLCNEQTVTLLRDAHTHQGVVAWTAHRWDINNFNVSRDMPRRVNPYQYRWSSSHLRTFDASLLKKVPDSNFKDHKGMWFERGYDQALMLPLLYVASDRKYIPDVCYFYRINSCSMPNRDWTEQKQLKTVNFVRARGFLSQ